MKRIKGLNKEKIISLYNSGLSEREVAKVIGVSRTTIRNNLIRYGVLGSRNGNINDEEKLNKKILTLSLLKTPEEISNELQIPKWIVSSKLKQMGIKIRNIRFTTNEDFFSNFTPESCYWAGFIAADGWVFKDIIGIEIHKKDLLHLKNFSQLVGFNGNINFRTNRNVCCLKFISEKTKQELEKNFNIVENKSLVLLPPDKVPEKMIVHFVRGYIDGDGYFAKNFNIMGCRGTKEILTWMRDNISKFCNVGNPKILKDHYYKMQFCGRKQCEKITQWLFKNSNSKIRLERKFDIVKTRYLKEK